jgi:hypothetical protein
MTTRAHGRWPTKRSTRCASRDSDPDLALADLQPLEIPVVDTHEVEGERQERDLEAGEGHHQPRPDRHRRAGDHQGVAAIATRTQRRAPDPASDWAPTGGRTAGNPRESAIEGATPETATF